MATYVIGDIHACFKTLQRLIETIRFDCLKDRLWLVGDLVNRGPGSLEVLRWVKGIGERAICVLGNHDLHLLAAARGVMPGRTARTFHPLLSAPDCEDLLDWLQHRPLIHIEESNCLVHAGLVPQWSLEEAGRLSREVESTLSGSQASDLLRYAGRRQALQGYNRLAGLDRLAGILQVMTQIRTCTLSGQLCLEFSGPPDQAPAGCLPWYDIPNRRSNSAQVFFGHWAALGVLRRPGVTALDAGCAWGGPLAAIRLEDGVLYQVPNLDISKSFPGV